MNFQELLAALPAHTLSGGPAPGQVAGLVSDSRQAGPDLLFAALKGHEADGHAFLEQVAARGAAAALVETPRPDLAGLCQVVVPDSRQALGLLAAAFHGQPSRRQTLVGVTGTNGKTTTTYLTEAVLARRGSVGVIGTVEIRYGKNRRPAAMTTPDPIELQAILADMLAQEVNQVVMEVSSHALDQGRVAGCAFDAAIFTNLTRDHLDYHGDMAHYLAAKRRLFEEFLPASRAQGKSPVAVICLDDPQGAPLAELCASLEMPVWTYGLETKAMVGAADINLGLDGGLCRVTHPGGDFLAVTPLVGGYNLQNLLAAATLGLALGMKDSEVAAGLASLEGVPGRLERIPGNLNQPAVFVDYAHSDAALAQALGTLRPLTRGRLFCVFGAGGHRDKGKRPLMGLAVGKQADLVALTSDNPRDEEPQAIMDMIAPGLAEAGCRPAKDFGQARPPAFIQEPDRARAIHQAITAAGPSDVVLIAGKGHEDYQIVGKEKHHFDDREQARAALKASAAREKAGRA